MDNLEKYTQAFCEAFEVEPEQAKNLKYQDIPAWDSVGHMGLISCREDAFDIVMDPADIIELGSFDLGRTMLRDKYGVQL